MMITCGDIDQQRTHNSCVQRYSFTIQQHMHIYGKTDHNPEYILGYDKKLCTLNAALLA